MKEITFGQFYPADSVLHRLDPRTKLFLTLVFIVSVFVAQTWYAYIAVFVYVAAILLISLVPLRISLRSVKGVLFLVLFTAVLNILFFKSGKVLLDLKFTQITLGGILFAAKTGVRLMLLAIGAAMLTFTTTPVQLTDGLESILSPFKKILPVHDIALIMSITLRFIPILMEEVNKIMMAQKARGACFDNGNVWKRAKALLPVLIPLFISAFRRAEELAQAMDARCYNATPNRTKMKELKFSYRDPVAVLVNAAYIVLIVAIDQRFWGLFAPWGWM